MRFRVSQVIGHLSAQGMVAISYLHTPLDSKPRRKVRVLLPRQHYSIHCVAVDAAFDAYPALDVLVGHDAIVYAGTPSAAVVVT